MPTVLGTSITILLKVEASANADLWANPRDVTNKNNRIVVSNNIAAVSVRVLVYFGSAANIITLIHTSIKRKIFIVIMRIIVNR